MIWREHVDIPAAMAGKLPPLFIQAIVALAGIGLAVGLRLTIERMVPGLAPFVLTFPVIAAATLLAGARAGLMTLIGCQLLIWYVLLPPAYSFEITSLTTLVNLSLVTAAQLLLLWAISSYRGVTARVQAESQQRIEDLSLALREIDHRTKNNFQTAIGLLEIQARNSGDEALQSALNRAAARLQAIAGVYQNLALSSAGLEDVRLHDYLRDICDRLRDGMLSPGVMLDLKTEAVTVRSETAIRIGLIINELVTNAAKHAFADGIGTVAVTLENRGENRGENSGETIRLTVRDDGKGLGDNAAVTDGLGSKLVAMLVRQIGAKLETETGEGTLCRLTIPGA